MKLHLKLVPAFPSRISRTTVLQEFISSSNKTKLASCIKENIYLADLHSCSHFSSTTDSQASHGRPSDMLHCYDHCSPSQNAGFWMPHGRPPDCSITCETHTHPCFSGITNYYSSPGRPPDLRICQNHCVRRFLLLLLAFFTTLKTTRIKTCPG